MSQHWAQRQSDSARRFFFVALGVFVFGAALAATLILLSRPLHNTDRITFPRAFAVSSVLLFAGSVYLQRALHYVRLERQDKFRTSLASALTAGTLFVGVQAFGLWRLMQTPIGVDASTGAGMFAFVFTVLHGMHLSIALLFLSYVTVRAYAGRYDHEYYWGVTCCAFFWHVLGIAWIVILAVFALTF